MWNYLCKAGLEQKIFKRQISQRQVKERRLSVFCLSLSPSTSFFTFFAFSLLCSKMRATHQTTKSYTLINLYTPVSPFISISSSKTSAFSSRKLFQAKFLSFPLFPPGLPTHKSWMSKSANIDKQTQFLKPHRLFSAIWTSSTLWPSRNLYLIWPRPNW